MGSNEHLDRIQFSYEMPAEGWNKNCLLVGIFFLKLTKHLFSYAAKELSFVQANINSEKQFEKLRKQFDDFIELDFLKATFVTTQEENVFAKSGFMPYKTICAYIWIRK